MFRAACYGILNSVMSVCGCIIALICGWYYFGSSGIGEILRMNGGVCVCVCVLKRGCIVFR